jgi:hypothetical protein
MKDYASWLATSDVLVGGDYTPPACIHVSGVTTLAHIDKMGIYVQLSEGEHGQGHNGKPVYKHTVGPHYLFYSVPREDSDIRQWGIGSASLEGSELFTYSSAATPDLIPLSSVWYVYTDSKFVDDPGVRSVLGSPLPCAIPSHDRNNPNAFYFQVRIDEPEREIGPKSAYDDYMGGTMATQSREDTGTRLDAFMIGAYREGLDHDLETRNWGSYAKHYGASSAWVVNLQNGGLYGGEGTLQDREPKCKQEKCTCHGEKERAEQGEGTIKVGDEVGVLIDMTGDSRRILFFKNGELYGPGFQDSSNRELDLPERLLFGVQMRYKGQRCTLQPDATPPVEPFVKWKGYREETPKRCHECGKQELSGNRISVCPECHDCFYWKRTRNSNNEIKETKRGHCECLSQSDMERMGMDDDY